MTDPRLKIAVFVDFDNIEIGVKTTLGQQFDIASVLEAIKERGEVVTKVAYADWKRAGDLGRQLSQHAIRMVQRNLTPGGDKNGADINLALDALEMAFTHDHINAFVIVGGDSDFITLVEKLKQYDKKVFVVGGRQFTSLVMQKNCHEFIAYENLVTTRSRPAAERRTPGAATDVSRALPLVKRALKVLVDREVTPQLGLLKSTLLQLDSTFSERDYGASTFRDFIEKVAQTGLVTLRHAGRSLLVELADEGAPPAEHAAAGRHAPAPRHEAPSEPRPPEAFATDEAQEAPEPAGAAHESPASGHAASAPPAPAQGSTATPDAEQAVQRAREIFARAAQPPRWPMYVRQVKQFLRAADEGFDERKYGFGSIVDFLRAGQRDAIFRLERDRQGVLRVFPGPNLQQRPHPIEEEDAEAGARVAAGSPTGEEPREGYGPMAEFLAEAAEAMVTGSETSDQSMPAPEAIHEQERAAAQESEPTEGADEAATHSDAELLQAAESAESTEPAAVERAPAPARARRTRKTAPPGRTRRPAAPRAASARKRARTS